MDSSGSNSGVFIEEGKVLVKDIEDEPLAEGEIRIRVEASPVNPSDKMYLQGLYGIKELIPKGTKGAGFEGAGVVIEQHESVEGDFVGKTVAFNEDCHSKEFKGAWRKFLNRPVKGVIPFPDGIEPSKVFAAFINPLTAVLMINQCKKLGDKALINGAASSSLGKILVKYAKKVGFPIINLVRRQEQVDLLQDLGAEHVLDSSNDTFDADLEKLSKELSATAYFDPIAGDFCSRVLTKMPASSTAYVYGALSGEDVRLSAKDIIFYQKSISYLYLASWFMTSSKEDQGAAFTEVVTDLSTGGEIFGTQIYKEFSLENFSEATEAIDKYATKGKVVINPQL